MATRTPTTDDAGPRVDRRPDFLELCHHNDGGDVVEQYAADIRASLSTVTTGAIDVAWVQGQSCTGCTMSMLQNEFPAIEGVLSEFRETVSFHPTLMDEAGETAMGSLGAGPDVLVVEGAVPVEIPRAATLGRDERGNPKPLVDWVIELGEAADLVIAVGSCAAYGGLPAAGRHDSDDVGADPTGARGLQFDGRDPGGVFGPAFRTGRDLPVVNVPGCPAHPEHVLLTLATVLHGHDPVLDEFNRPLPIFGPLVHDDCSLREEYESGNFADHPGDDGCLYEAGCAGVYAYCDDSKRLRNGGTTICRDVGAPCIGCVEPAFWDRFTPFYEPGLDRGDAGRDGHSKRDYRDAAADPDETTGVREAVADASPVTNPVGALIGAVVSLLLVPLLPGAAAAAALVRWLDICQRRPEGPVALTGPDDRATRDS
ncbi:MULTISPECIES: hypothetical protein [Haloarcula]|uniref:NADH-quinone oxidoreductase subunit B family protein n=1 Tax=Haloarcula TaxID=2237 RepID=UPI0023EAAE9B|nr:hypothetical protein [Halomicroarcula sp. XH51]